jgi:hypothetical protein
MAYKESAVLFKKGDKVKVLRKATSHENGWENSWEPEMDSAVGKTGTVVADKDVYAIGLRHNVNVKVSGVDQFGYPSFVLELVRDTPVPFKKFKVGDKVQVKYGYGWDGPGIVWEDWIDGTYSVTLNEGRRGTFDPKYLTLLPPVAPIAAVPAKKEFKVGDRVQVNYGYGWDGPGTVTKVGAYVHVKPDHRSEGGFARENLTLLSGMRLRVENPAPQAEVTAKEKGIAGAVKSHSKVFGIAKDLAVKLAKSNSLKITSADTVQAELVKLGYTSADLGNAAGALFRGKNWEKMDRQPSGRRGNHAREISVWKYTGA